MQYLAGAYKEREKIKGIKGMHKRKREKKILY